MKAALFILIMLFTGLCSTAQIKSVVVDGNTKEVIPYVNIWVENENIGTTSNEEGEFELNVTDTNKIIVFSAIGYATTKIKVSNIGKEVTLMPQATVLQEVFMRLKKGTRTLGIGRFRKSEIHNYFGSAVSPWMVANYFGYQEEYKNTPYLKKLNILTDSQIKNATFNIRLYSINEKGKPGDYLYDKNIIGLAKRGKMVTEVDLSSLNIQFPKNGFFIAFEWLLIESNKYHITYTRSGSKEKYTGIRYAPSIGSVTADEEYNSWRYVQGSWTRWYKPSIISKSGRYSFAAIELTLTN